MKERALQIADAVDTDLEKRNQLREYLQHVILRELFDLDILEKLVFHGGTALRLIHGLERFSEDLDFHVETPESELEMEEWTQELNDQLIYQGYRSECSPPGERNVQTTNVKFAGLLYEAGVSRHENEKLRIKLEVDTNPPPGFGVEKSRVDHFFPYVVHHHDPSSFMAGKLHAVFQREWTKGRDYYDLMFYLTRWKGIEPNFEYLNNALDQTGYHGVAITADNWRQEVAQEVENADWRAIQADLEPFVLRRSDLKAFQREFLLEALEQ